ncbi:transcription termination/antitermination protein NusG [Alkalibacter rhizosphaerae]|uniref:Transcription termination/antitermination protein NusG n=1 Tax=Alkalibacter rhizosphaerae TaxID=2815577 RepID=A0A974XCV8_9FIRM|nr:transcription termination/antitermination protein NusG [Alkalibacter rhizosphaerae]QSX07502.1 transcription termination/antitermination protein NusG [Alkalibacter rhizosphaerae]
MMNQNEEAKWYVAHTYSGYENKVKANIEAAVENRNMQNQIFEVHVPMQEVEEVKNGKRKISQKKVFPGYILVKMVMTDESWYVVRNTRGVTGFVGPASKPVALTKSELKSMGIKEKLPQIDIQIGDSVKVQEGPLEGFTGIVEEVNHEKQKLKVNISMFGRETPAELEFTQVAKF